MTAQLVSLISLSEGSRAVIGQICLPSSDRERLQELGLTTGTDVEVVRYAPFGDPVEIKFRGSHLTLHKHEAERILVASSILRS